MSASVEATSDVTSSVQAGLLTAAMATLIGFVSATVVAALATGFGGSPIGVVRTGARAWLVGLGSGLTIDGTAITLVPIGGTVLVALIVALVARWARREQTELRPFAASAAAGAGALAALLSVLSNSSSVTTSPVRAAFGGFIVVGLAAALALGGVTSALQRVSNHGEASAVLVAASRGVGAFLGVCAVLVLLGLVTSIDRAGELWAALDPGLVGGIGLGLICIVAVPTLLLWSGAVLLGPGIEFGTDTSLDLTGSYLGAVPGLPILSALPEPGPFGAWAIGLGLVPVLVGLGIGWWLSVQIGRAHV